jgi:5-methylcytosine-specific restriction enzyme subunit McrC
MTLHTLRLREFQTSELPAEALSEKVGEFLWNRYRNEIQVEPPTFKTSHQWRITPQGWAGHIPFSESLHIHIEPKVEIGNLFRMLEYAYRLEFLATGDLVGTSSLEEFYERLANLLALRVLDRSRKGLHREYVERSGRLPYLRGKLVLEAMLAKPWETALDCRYEEHTADIEDNQILAWTLYRIARTGISRPEVAHAVRRAFRATQGVTELKTFRASDCVGRDYTRLNADYRILHALCRFFLDHSGPSHDQEDRSMLPFLIDMAKLYELFVAEWLRKHLPPQLALKEQARVVLGTGATVEFRIDLLLTDRLTGKPVALLDTKYKAAASPSAGDVEQVIAYAKTVGCPKAVLVYPQPLAMPFGHVVGGDIHVWTTHFQLAGDLEANGQNFLNSLMIRLSSQEVSQ